MQRIKLELFKSFFEKNLTGNEIDFIFALSYVQDERGKVYGLHYKEMMQWAGMSAQAFYDCKKSLQEKGVIVAEHRNNDYDITLLGNDFSSYTSQDYQTGNVKYISTNRKLFTDKNFKKLKPKQKLLAMHLLNISTAGERTYRISRERFFATYADNVKPDGSIAKGLLGVSRRTLQKYLKMLQLYFSIGLKDGIYFFTLRREFAKKSEKNSEHEVTYKRVIEVACRRNRILDNERMDEPEILKTLCSYRSRFINTSIYLPGIFDRMLCIINETRLNTKKWKRYLKATLFAKVLKEELA